MCIYDCENHAFFSDFELVFIDLIICLFLFLFWYPFTIFMFFFLAHKNVTEMKDKYT